MFEYMQMYVQLVSFDDIKNHLFDYNSRTLITIRKKDRSKDCDHFI